MHSLLYINVFQDETDKVKTLSGAYELKMNFSIATATPCSSLLAVM